MALIGGANNLGSNIIQGNISGSFWEVLGQSVGAASGTLSLYVPAGWLAGGAIGSVAGLLIDKAIGCIANLALQVFLRNIAVGVLTALSAAQKACRAHLKQ